MSKSVREWVESIFFAAIIVAVLFVVFWPFVISGDSMEDSFFDRDRIAISRALLLVVEISHGDVILCRLEGNDETVIKRVIAVPGDNIRISGGDVYINGSILREDYLREAYTQGELDLTLGAGEYFVMGDNRGVSYDSRDAGPVHYRAVAGKVVLRWYPFNRISMGF